MEGEGAGARAWPVGRSWAPAHEWLLGPVLMDQGVHWLLEPGVAEQRAGQAASRIQQRFRAHLGLRNEASRTIARNVRAYQCAERRQFRAYARRRDAASRVIAQAFRAHQAVQCAKARDAERAFFCPDAAAQARALEAQRHGAAGRVIAQAFRAHLDRVAARARAAEESFFCPDQEAQARERRLQRQDTASRVIAKNLRALVARRAAKAREAERGFFCPDQVALASALEAQRRDAASSVIARLVRARAERRAAKAREAERAFFLSPAEPPARALAIAEGWVARGGRPCAYADSHEATGAGVTAGGGWAGAGAGDGLRAVFLRFATAPPAAVEAAQAAEHWLPWPVLSLLRSPPQRAPGDEEPLLDSRGFQKLCRAAGLVGARRLSPTQLDVLFASVKPRAALKINFAAFQRLTHLLARKLGRSHAEVAALIAASAGTPMPRIHPDWYEVENQAPAGAADAFYYANRVTGEASWEAPLVRATEAVQPPPPPPPPRQPKEVSRPQRAPGKRRLYPSVHPVLVLGGAPPVKQLTEASSAVAEATGAEAEAEAQAEAQAEASGTVAEANGVVTSDQKHADHEYESKDEESLPRNFSRLTDPALYTGAHKHRFDKDGRGRGLNGRDMGAKGKGALPASQAPRTGF